MPTKKQRQRQAAVAAGHLPPSQAEVRFSARRTAQVANYNEEEDEDEFEEDEDDATPNYWAPEPEETGPIIDKILDHRPKAGTGTTYRHSRVLSVVNIIQKSIHITLRRRTLSTW
jgi:chromodomain-helicase-DNA-binding protein 1